MIRRVVRFGETLLAVAVCFWPLLAKADVCAPPHLVHIVMTNVSPGVQSGTFNAQPRVLYRQGNDKARIEEALDAANNIHGLMVIAEPNLWMVNLADQTGKHIVDPGPTFNAKSPVFGFSDADPTLIKLEFGCEPDFLAANAPKPACVEAIDGVSYDVFRVQSGTDAVEILERQGTAVPAFARYYRSGTLLMAWRYDTYETSLPLNPQLFVRPAGVNYVEQRVSQ